MDTSSDAWSVRGGGVVGREYQLPIERMKEKCLIDEMLEVMMLDEDGPTSKTL